MGSLGLNIGLQRFRKGANVNQTVELLAPSYVSATGVSANQINVSFTINATDYDGHRIFISTDAINFTEKGTVSVGENYFPATGLTQDTGYYFYVVAYKGSTESTPSNVDGDYTGIQVSNIFINSDTFLSDITAHWQTYLGTKTVVGTGEMYFTRTGNGFFQYRPILDDSYPSNLSDHIFYMKLKAKPTTAFTPSFGSAALTGTLVTGEYALMSVILNGITNVNIDYFKVQLPNDGDILYMKDFMLIDLTNLYGAGNEPDKATCDSLFGDVYTASSEVMFLNSFSGPFTLPLTPTTILTPLTVLVA